MGEGFGGAVEMFEYTLPNSPKPGKHSPAHPSVNATSAAHALAPAQLKLACTSNTHTTPNLSFSIPYSGDHAAASSGWITVAPTTSFAQ